MKGAFTFAIQTDHGLVELGYIQAVQTISEPAEANNNDEINGINTAEFSMEVVLKPQYLRNFRWIEKGERPWTNARRKRIHFTRKKRERRISYEPVYHLQHRLCSGRMDRNTHNRLNRIVS